MGIDAVERLTGQHRVLEALLDDMLDTPDAGYA